MCFPPLKPGVESDNANFLASQWRMPTCKPLVSLTAGLSWAASQSRGDGLHLRAWMSTAWFENVEANGTSIAGCFLH
jgi:hypothetical protein